MFHFTLLRSVRPIVYHNQRVRGNYTIFESSVIWKGVFSQSSNSHLMAHERENLFVDQTGDFMKDTRFVNKTTVRLGTFNLLAPCYKNIEPRTWKTWWGGRKESSQPEQFLSRYEETFKIFDSLPKFDFMCLQEFWFDSGIAELFEKRVGERYYYI